MFSGDMTTKKNKFNVCTVSIFVMIICGVRGQYYRHNDYHPSEYYGELHPPEEAPVYCFQCTTVIDKDCAYIQPNDTSNYHYKPCLDSEKYNGTRPFCRKIVQTIKVRNNMEVIIRKCSWIRHPRLDCYNNRNEDHDETVCQCFENACNAGPSTWLLSSTTLTLAGVLACLRCGGM